MKVLLKPQIIVITGEPGSPTETVAQWIREHAGHAFVLGSRDGMNFWLKDLGPAEEACREPINILSTSTNEAVRLISNFAHTPFYLDGKYYASVEGFWQGLKFSDETQRDRLAEMFGPAAKTAGGQSPLADTLTYGGQEIRPGTREHWSLMYNACWAKFTQHLEARAALLSTGSRPIVHKTRRDSKTIPGIVMADIWTRVRSRLPSGDAF